MSISKELVTIYDPSKAYDGYTLFGPMGSKDEYLIDMKGRFVHHWSNPHTREYGKLLPNGNLLVAQKLFNTPVADLPAAGGQLLELDWDGNVVWKYEDPYMNGHEFDRMKNGNTMVSHWVPVPNDIAAKVKGGVPGSERQGVIWGDCFREISPEGKVVWEWTAHEHMDFEVDILCPLCPRSTLTYANSLVVLPDGNIMTNFRVINTVAIIDKGTGNIIWRWGPGELAHAHNPTFLDNGNILVFDNGMHRLLSTSGYAYSRVLEVNIETKKIAWEYTAEDPFSFFSSVCSNAQRLPNGNTLICEATKGRFFELTQDKAIVWEFTNPFRSAYRLRPFFGLSNMVYRAHRYGLDYEGLRGKTLDPDRFEWVLEEKGKGRAEEMTTGEEAVSHRLAGLGY